MTTPFPIAPPIEPMLAKLATEIPDGDGFLFEPKWDGFRAHRLSRRRGCLHPEPRPQAARSVLSRKLHDALRSRAARRLRTRRRDRHRHSAWARFRCPCRCASTLPPLVSPSSRSRRRRPSSRLTRWRSTGRTCAASRSRERRVRLERLLADAAPPIHLTPMTRDRAQASEWLARFEGAGLDGVIAKPVDGRYQPGKRAMIKVKHARTADCVVAGFRWHKDGRDGCVGSLLLGLVRRQGTAAARRRDLGVHDGDARAAAGGAGAAARTRARGSPVAGMGGSTGRDDAYARRPEPLERRQGPVMGAAAHRARLRSEVRPHAGHAVPPRGRLPALARRQAADATAATTSSRSRPLTSFRRCSARRRGVADAFPVVGHVLVGVQWLLSRAKGLGHVLEVHAHARPRAEAAPHRIDEHVGVLQVPGRPPGGAPSSVQIPQGRRPSHVRARSRRAAGSASGGVTAPHAAAHRPASDSEAATARRPGPSRSCRADSSSNGRARGVRVHARVAVADLPRNGAGMVASVKSAGSHVGDLVPGERRRDARIGPRPDRVRGGDRAVFGVLVVVQEHALTFLFPPLARRATRACAARLRAPAPARLDAPGRRSIVARCAHRRASRASPRSLAIPTSPRSSSVARTDAGDLADLRPLHARHRIEIDAQLVGMVEVVGANRMRVQLETRQVGHPHEGGRLPGHDLFGRPAGRETSARRHRAIGSRLRRPLLEEEFAVDAVGIADQDVGPAAGALQGPLGDGDVVAGKVELGVAGQGNRTLRGFEIATSRSPTVRISCSGSAAIA